MQPSLHYPRLWAAGFPLNALHLSGVGGLSFKVKPVIWAALFLFMFLGGAFNAQASHYRAGNITWTTVTSDPTNRTLQFRIAVSYRSSEFSGVAVGAVLSDGWSFNYGDGTSTPSPVSFTVTSVNGPGDYFFAETTLTKAYSTTGNFTAYFTSGARLSTLQNNADGSYYVSTVAKPGSGNRSPIATLPPIVNLAAGQANASLQINAFDADSDPLTFSLPTATELGGITFSQPSGFSVSSSGLLTFNTVGRTNGQLYSAIVKVSDGKTFVLLDFLIQIRGSGNPPAFVYGGVTPNNGSVISGFLGSAVTFTVRATDPNATDQVSLQAYGVPPGATFAPVLPASGTPTASTVFSWTPTSVGSTLISFTAEDPSGNQVTTTVTITVVISPVPACNTFVKRIVGIRANPIEPIIKVNDVFVAGTTVYAATSNGGLHISTDGGKTFMAHSGSARQTIDKIFVQGNTIYASSPGGLSLINGQTVTPVLSKSLAPNDVFAVGNTIYVSKYGPDINATASSFGISTNNGGSFTFYPIAPPDQRLTGRCVYAIGNKIFVGSTGGTTSGLYVSTNNGASFSKISTTSGIGNAIYGFENTVYFASSEGLFISTDGGGTFTQRTRANGLAGNFVLDVFAVGTTVYAATDFGLYISTNGGVSFTNYNSLDGLGSSADLFSRIRAVYAAGTTVYAVVDLSSDIVGDGLYASDFAIRTSVKNSRAGSTNNVAFQSITVPRPSPLTDSPSLELVFQTPDINTGYIWNPSNATTRDLSTTITSRPGVWELPTPGIAGRFTSTYSVTATGGSCPGSASVVLTILSAQAALAIVPVPGNGFARNVNFAPPNSRTAPPPSVGPPVPLGRLATPVGSKAATATYPALIVNVTGPSGYVFNGRAKLSKNGSPQDTDNYTYEVALTSLTQPGTYTMDVFDAITKELLSVYTFTL